LKVLTPLQEALLRKLGASPVGSAFFLTGGTALAAFYLEHRLSEDLDLFTEDPGAIDLVRPTLEEIARTEGGSLEFARTYPRFLQCFLRQPGGEEVKMDFAVDSPYRLEPVRPTEYGIAVDGPLDIACNKLSALFDRAAGKDFVDVWFVHREVIPFAELLPKARQKHVGMEDYWLAQSFARARRVAVWPRMLKPLDVDEMVRFFGELSDAIIAKAERPEP
jgi:predicted nucleotidyltransferase component of viral defense system